MRLRLTDQALVAVALARAAAQGGPVAATHLLAGLAAEPDGAAGQRLRERSTAAAALAEGAGNPRHGSLDGALRLAAQRAGSRAITTVDLLDAAMGSAAEIEAVLVDGGYDLARLRAAPDESVRAETVGLGSDQGFDARAGAAVARVRAGGGGAVDLLLSLAESIESLPDPEVLRERRIHGLRSTPETGTDRPWDAGLDAVVAAAAVLRTGAQTTSDDLVLAALVVGGEGPQLLLRSEDDA